MPTATPVPGATATTAPGGCIYLDCFTRVNGAVGVGWLGQTASYSLNSNQLQAASDAYVIWPTMFGGDQQVSVKVTSVLNTGSKVSLFLKALNGSHTEGVIEVAYIHGSGVQVYTYRQNPNWMWSPFGNNIALSLAANDRFGARAEPSGLVSILKNNVVVATVMLVHSGGQWDVARSGQAGLWTDAPGMLLDDFDAATVGAGGATNTPVPANL